LFIDSSFFSGSSALISFLVNCASFLVFSNMTIKKVKFRRIPRWQQEGGSRKWASHSEILERHQRHTLQA
jgi:hypothetical protein